MSARFLVVEDDTAYAENLTDILALSGFSAERVRTAAEARKLAAQHGFDVALVDLALPDARGNELVAELRSHSPYLMAIVLTGQPTLTSARDAIRSGATAYLLKDGDPRELEAVIRRAAEQASLARALRESEKRYELLVERAPLGIALVKAGKYTFANERYAQIFGVGDARSLIGLPVETVYHADARPMVRDHWRLDRTPFEETYAKTGIRRADGLTIDVLVTRARIEVEGEVAVQLIVRDITEENRLTRELDEARAQLEDKRRLAALGEMVAGIAHEIRNPLQGVAWGMNELRARFERDPSAHEALEKIASSTREIEAIVAEVLDYARPMRLERISFPARDLLEAVREDVMVEAQSSGVLVEVDPSSSSFEASMDAMKMKQALVNLARNAIEASPRGGRVLLRAIRAPHEPAVRFMVEDEGSGVPVDLREKIFLPFVTTKVKGTGLGLPVVRRVVEAHGGTIRLDARAPRGTIASIELPATAA